ncbi:MAG: GNAT family N-acetyltransferase [Pseudotabrizicola sp.]|uniref:GNAT family N-acetyltransferase n=1 Tax=Pseudotabrizicola sp. TaxID=2939647 RepID=UPI00271BF3C4|nr:GNAT family N-acetyltransferase [Pseudotabrizicola sp.]MDO8883081.1 GNAT family N-acetyltransferase [Pseudotabrizicola sp.]MDP2082368.1 GNAT family N-acetyltransferase [Pseudotabrizicola sp.]MDZ7574305.1 GNAT family N-acetyltransferase [Pseudotabrizicola sp.]
MTLQIRKARTGDFAGWSTLYAGYAAFYEVEQTEAMRERVWGWVNDPAHEVEGFVAEQDGQLVGLAHFRAFARPLSASEGGFLDDLFVSPEARGSGTAAALIAAIKAEGQSRGWTVIRWITAENNARARGLYDQIATATAWVTYDLKL